MKNSKLAVLIVLLVATSLVSPLGLPLASAGCPSTPFMIDGPYRSSAKGFAGIDNRTIGSHIWDVYVIDPGASANLTFTINMDTVEPHYPWTLQMRVQPIREYDQVYVPWLSVSFSNDTVVFKQPMKSVNVTVTLHVDENALHGDYAFTFDAVPTGGCSFPWTSFALRVGREKPTRAFTLSYSSSTIKGQGDVRTFSAEGREGGQQLQALLVALDKNSSAELRLHITSESPWVIGFKTRLENLTDRQRNMTSSELGTNISESGSGHEYYPADVLVRTLDQHQSGNSTLTLTPRKDVSEGAYTLLLVIHADEFFNPVRPVQTSDIPISIWVGKNNSNAISIRYTVTMTTVSTSTSTVTAINTTTEMFTKTVSTTSTTTLTSTLTSTTTAKSIERVVDFSTYAWAVTATAATIVLAIVLFLQRKTRSQS